MPPNQQREADLRTENARLRQRVAELSARLEQRHDLDTEAFATVLSSLPDLIFIISAEGRYLEIYTGEHNLLAAPYKELRGRTVHEALPAAAARGIQDIIDLTLKVQTTQSIDYPLEVATGTRWFNATIVPIKFALQTAVLWVARDVTERKLAERETQRARDAAIESNRLKSQFLANVSHELRTPLNGVIGFAEILDDTALNDSQAEYLGHLTDCANTLLSIINEILDFSRLEANRVSLVHAPFDLPAMVRQVVEWFRINNRTRPLTFTCEIDDTIAARVVSDAGRVRQILVNLLGNAAKFTQSGTIAVRLVREDNTGDDDAGDDARTDAQSDVRDYVSLSVSDTGMGISESALTTIFDPFVQADGSASRQFTGTGLGLSIVRTLVGLLDGAIDVDSTVDVGTTFTVTLPLKRADEDESAEEHGAPGSDHPARPTTGEPALTQSLSILVAEDNPLGQKIIDRLLKSWGHRATIASDGERALELLASEHFDLILMDCHMPGVDGYEATRRIRAAQGAKRRIPIVALTANAMQDNRDACFEAGMDDYLTKPLVRDALAAALRRWAATDELKK